MGVKIATGDWPFSSPQPVHWRQERSLRHRRLHAGAAEATDRMLVRKLD